MHAIGGSPVHGAGAKVLRTLRTGAWYGDKLLALEFPPDWDVAVFWPATPPPLTDEQILERLEQPVGQLPLPQLVQGKSRPLVIVDDLTRPTPAGRVFPLLLRQFQAAGIAPPDVTVLMANGAHARPASDAIAKKVGPEAAASCRLLIHDYERNLAFVGRTSFGTPVLVNRVVLRSDFVIGIAGIYPQHSTGFGGGSKLALGVLGKRSIIRLHYGHPSGEGSYDIDNNFRRDLDEIARMIRLTSMISVHVDANREVVRLVSGDHHAYYRDAVAFSREAYLAPPPGEADVVLSNAYPIDVSLTFMRSKGMTPLYHAAPRASRILISASAEGMGYHGLFPFLNGPRFQRQLHLARRISAMGLGTAARKIALRAGRRLLLKRRPSPPGQPRSPIWLYPPGVPTGSLPSLPWIWEGSPERLVTIYAWSELLEKVKREQARRMGLRAVVYPCAPLQVLDLDPSMAAGHGIGD